MNGTTLDFVIKDYSDMMVLINIVQHAVYKPSSQERLAFYKILRVKMKVGYLAWANHIKTDKLFLRAIVKTLVDKLTLTISNI